MAKPGKSNLHNNIRAIPRDLATRSTRVGGKETGEKEKSKKPFESRVMLYKEQRKRIQMNRGRVEGWQGERVKLNLAEHSFRALSVGVNAASNPRAGHSRILDTNP